MTLEDILLDIHALEQDLQAYERKYGVLSETFYESFANGEEPQDASWVRDWAAWAGAYEIWLRRRDQYQAAIRALRRQTPVLANVIERTARHESIPIPA